MSIASEILRIQQAKQAIKESINNKGGTLTNETIDNYAQAIDNLPSGDMTYEDYARTLYLIRGKLNQFTTAWQHSLGVDHSEISATSTTSNQRGKAQYPNGETEGVIIPEGVTSIGDRAFQNWEANNQPLIIPEGVTSIGTSAFQIWTSNNQPLIIPSSLTSIGRYAFQTWTSNTHTLVIQQGVTSIGEYAFRQWTSNNEPLVIPDSVTSIDNYAFRDWSANEHPLVIPGNVTSIGSYAFYGWSSVPYVLIQAFTPPTLVNVNAFSAQNNAPIYVADFVVDAYKTATNWAALASRIFPYSDM